MLPFSIEQKWMRREMGERRVCSTHYTIADTVTHTQTHTVLSSFKKSIRSRPSATPSWHLSPSPFRWLSHFSAALPRYQMIGPSEPCTAERPSETRWELHGKGKCMKMFQVFMFQWAMEMAPRREMWVSLLQIRQGTDWNAAHFTS